MESLLSGAQSKNVDFNHYAKKLTSLTWTARSPLHVNRVTWYVSVFTCPGPEENTPSIGMMQGLKYDKNFSVSWPWTSLYCTVWDPRASSNSSALSDARAESTCKFQEQLQNTKPWSKLLNNTSLAEILRHALYPNPHLYSTQKLYKLSSSGLNDEKYEARFIKRLFPSQGQLISSSYVLPWLYTSIVSNSAGLVTNMMPF